MSILCCQKASRIIQICNMNFYTWVRPPLSPPPLYTRCEKTSHLASLTSKVFCAPLPPVQYSPLNGNSVKLRGKILEQSFDSAAVCSTRHPMSFMKGFHCLIHSVRFNADSFQIFIYFKCIYIHCKYV